MNWWLPHKFDEKRPFLEKRMAVIVALRRFFDDQGFWEVSTPVLQTCPTADEHIHGFETMLWNHDLKPEQTLYLQSSPEFEMKKLMVAGVEKLYQMCPVFRNAEGSRLHSPEFTMLEWYRAGQDYTALMDDCVEILRKLPETLGFKSYTYGVHTCDPHKDFLKISVAEAFERFAKIDLDAHLDDRDGFKRVIEQQGIRTAEDDTWDDLFFRVMGEKIEPHLGMGTPCLLYDYPICMASLARPKVDDPRWAERFELYVCGVELANAFSELTDAHVQRERFVASMTLKQELYGYTYPVDEDFLRALEHGLPESAGIALGVDRLVMLATGAEDIKQVLWAYSS